MKRYFAQLQYKGSDFSGWQSQPNAETVQDEIELHISKLLRKAVKIVGCGRTDAGVHASDYYFHFDNDDEINPQMLFKLNLMLPHSIVVKQIFEVEASSHARFDALERSYEYHIHKYKNPFKLGLSYHYEHLFDFDLNRLNEVAQIILLYKDFYTFCKSNTDVKTTLCSIKTSKWLISGNQLKYEVTADRFLRGMIRLIVGTCIQYAQGKVTLDEIETALDQKSRLKQPLSAPAHGLYLSKIVYPDSIHTKESSSYNY